MRWSRYGMQSAVPRLARALPVLQRLSSEYTAVIDCVRIQGVLERCPKLVGLLLISRQDYCAHGMNKLLSYMPNTLCILQMHHCHMSYEVLLELGRTLPHLQVFLLKRCCHRFKRVTSYGALFLQLGMREPACLLACVAD